jgi:hypothetical protein
MKILVFASNPPIIYLISPSMKSIKTRDVFCIETNDPV